MRFKSTKQQGYVIYAVAGTDVVSFGIDFDEADTQGLLGFAVERHDITEQERYFMKGFKVFKEMVPFPEENLLVSTNEHPVQSFVWDDFTAKPEHEYDYYFYPIKGQPKFLKREKAVELKVKTEPLYTDKAHDVFFNRGVASSQEYARRFFNLPPDKITDPVRKQEAYDWLSRNLEDALYRFIDQAQPGDSLFGCFYEFHYRPVLDRFKAAIDRQVNVQLIIDGKDNSYTDKDGDFHEAFPFRINEQILGEAGITENNYTLRTAMKSSIAHNKFLIYQRSQDNDPSEVWTGSTNISEGGIFGQTNVGHWVRSVPVATAFKQYWDILQQDPGGKEGDTKSEVLKANKEFRQSVDTLSTAPTFAGIMGAPVETKAVFSPRPGLETLDTYFELVDQAKNSAFITLAFGVNDRLKTLLLNNTFQNPVVFMLLEKKDAPSPNSKNKDAFIALNAMQNVYQAYGSYITDKLYKWARETNTRFMGLNSHVLYVHSKFLLRDPLGAEPVVVTGSANFSEASTKDNDENMLIIKGDARAADIYFTEFNRLFNHYYYRSVLQELKVHGEQPSGDSLFLMSTDKWLEKYQPGKLRLKRLDIFRKMHGAAVLKVVVDVPAVPVP